MDVKAAIYLARIMHGMKQRAAALARNFGDTKAGELLDKDAEALETLIDVAERVKADGD